MNQAGTKNLKIKRVTIFLFSLALCYQLLAQVVNFNKELNQPIYQLKEILIGDWRLCSQIHGKIEITSVKCPTVTFLPENMGFYHTSYDTFVWKEMDDKIYFKFLRPQKSNKFKEQNYYYKINEWGSFLTVDFISMDSVHRYELLKWKAK